MVIIAGETPSSAMYERPLASMPVTMRRTGGRVVDMERDLPLGEPPRRVLESLDPERVAGRVVQDQRGLLADVAAKADAGLDDEARAAVAQARRELVPVVPVQHHAEMRHRYVLAVHLVEVQGAACRVQGG